MKQLLMSLTVMASMTAPIYAIAANDPDSIGRAVKYLDYVVAKPLLMSVPGTNCDGTIYRCATLSDIGVGSITIPDFAVIDVAADSSRSLLCMSMQTGLSYVFRNFATDSTPRTAQIMLQPSVTIDSTVLSDPSLINRLTGQPFNGSIVRTLPTYLDEQILALNQSGQHAQNWSSDCTKGLLSRSSLINDYGLSPLLAQRVITSQLKLTFSVVDRNSSVRWSNHSLSIRMYSD